MAIIKLDLILTILWIFRIQPYSKFIVLLVFYGYLFLPLTVLNIMLEYITNSLCI